MIGKLKVPFLAMMGNHDDRALMREAFPGTPWQDTDHNSWVADIGHITLDATVKPTVLAMHHPPFLTGHAWMDALGFKGLDAAREVIASHSAKLIRVVCGHFHRPVVTTVEGITTSICPATVHHMELDLGPLRDPRVVFDPRGYQLR